MTARSHRHVKLHGDIDVGPLAVPPDAAAARAERDAATVELGRVLGDPPALVLTSSCTHALEASATVLGVGPGDEVIVPAYTFPSTANGFLLRGATVRFADIEADTVNVSARTVEACLTERTRVVVVMHYAGIAADVAAITDAVRTSDASVVEDAAHGIFASWNGVPLGRLGRLGCLSFHRTKNIATGEGGALIVNDPELADAVHVAVDKGTNRHEFEAGVVARYDWTGVGSGWRMADPLLPLLRRQLARADRTQTCRLAAWERYHRELGPWARAVDVALPLVPAGASHPAHIFQVLLPDADARRAFVAHCADGGVEAIEHYGALPDSPFGQRLRHPDDDCPVAHDVAARLVRLPMHADLDADDVDYVIDVVTAWR